MNAPLNVCRHGRAPHTARGQRGVALAIVVWFVAGMSLLVSGIVAHARLDTKMAQAHVARAKAVAAGDGAISLLLAAKQVGLVEPSIGGAYGGSYRLGDSPVRVALYPARGLLDLNAASHAELSALFSIAAGLEAADADALADNVLAWRESSADAGNRGGGRNRFSAIEDLVRVEGIGRTQFDAVRDFVVAGTPASGNIDWAYAPPGLLAVLESIDPQRVATVMGRREALADRGGASNGATGAWRADALVSYGGRQWLRRRWITPGEDAVSGLPWRVVRTEPPRVVAAVAAGPVTGRSEG